MFSQDILPHNFHVIQVVKMPLSYKVMVLQGSFVPINSGWDPVPLKKQLVPKNIINCFDFGGRVCCSPDVLGGHSSTQFSCNSGCERALQQVSAIGLAQ